MVLGVSGLGLMFSQAPSITGGNAPMMGFARTGILIWSGRAHCSMLGARESSGIRFTTILC